MLTSIQGENEDVLNPLDNSYFSQAMQYALGTTVRSTAA